MTLPAIPDWLLYFRLTISNANEELIFDSWNNDVNILRFEDPLGAQIGGYLKIVEDRFKVVDIEIYTSGLSVVDRSIEKVGFQVNLIVENV